MPYWSSMNRRLPSKLSFLSQAVRQEKTEFFTAVLCSWLNWPTRFIIPLLPANSWTWRLFVIIEVIRLHAARLTSSASWVKIRLRRQLMPPIRHRLRLFLAWISASSVISSRSSTTYSLVDSSSWLPQALSWLTSSASLSVSLKVCAFMASSSHSRSSLDIALNSDGLVPSWYYIDHL